jgi:hypothetical protein
MGIKANNQMFQTKKTLGKGVDMLAIIIEPKRMDK